MQLRKSLCLFLNLSVEIVVIILKKVMQKTRINLMQGLIPFSIVVVGLSSLLFLYLYLVRQPVVETHGLRKEISEVLGTLGLWALMIIYGRSILKLTLNDGTFLQRIIPGGQYSLSLSACRKLLFWLNRTHKHVGAGAIVLLAGHALLMNTIRLNIFLSSVLYLLVWQGVFGLFLVIRVPNNPLKKYGRLAHAQLFSGIMIGVFASFGHLLV